MVRWTLLGLGILLAGCGENDGAAEGTPPVRNAAAGLSPDQQVGIALFPGSRLVSSSSATGELAAGGVFQLETSSTPGEVAAFYKDAAEAAGWTVRTNVNAGAMRIIGATKGAESLNIQVSNRAGAPGSTVVVVRGQGARPASSAAQ